MAVPPPPRMQERFAYVLLLSKPMLTAYEQPSFSLHLNGFTDQSLAVSFITELWLLCYDPGDGRHH